VSVTIISADSAVKWNGGLTGNWDINNAGNAIWQTVPSGSPTYYVEAGTGNDAVLFDDSLTGTPNVILTTTLAPQAITVSNSSANYIFAGSGKLTGATGLTKQGSGTLTIANGGNNDFSGTFFIDIQRVVFSGANALTFSQTVGPQNWTIVGDAGANAVNVAMMASGRGSASCCV